MQHRFKSTMLLISVFAALTVDSFVYGQKCEYNTDGLRSVPFVWSIIEIKGPTVRNVRGHAALRLEERLEEITVILWRMKRKERIYIGTAITDKNGFFCFGSQESGIYELDLGAQGFQKTVIRFKVSAASSRELIEAEMDIGY